MLTINDIKFNMFGVPEGFDSYGSSEDITKLQMYYDGSEENVKIHIWRKSNGEITYAYLRYGMISGGDRRGSFFGMAVTFKNEYCADVNTLYELFNRIYTGIIKEGKILEVLQNGKVKYKINSFKKVNNLIQYAESYMKKNLIEGFQEDIHPLDNSFLSDNLNKVATIKSEKNNQVIIDALKKYGVVVILPEIDNQPQIQIYKDAQEKINNEIKNNNADKFSDIGYQHLGLEK